MKQAAQRKGVGYFTVSRAVRTGRLPHLRFGRQVFITPDALDAWQPKPDRAPRKYRRPAPDLSVVPLSLTHASLDRAELEATVTTLATALIQRAGSLPEEQLQEASQTLSRILLEAEHGRTS
jgi:excisionase family DNA binding protein